MPNAKMWLSERCKGFFDNWLYDHIGSQMVAGGFLILCSVGGALWKAIREEPVPWGIFGAMCALGIVLLFVAITKLPKTSINEGVQPETNPYLKRADSNAITIKRRVAEVEEAIKANLSFLTMTEHLNIESPREDLYPPMKRVERVEKELIDEAYLIDREMQWPEYRKMGLSIGTLNDGILSYDQRPTQYLSHELFRQIEEIRKHIVVIASEQASK